MPSLIDTENLAIGIDPDGARKVRHHVLRRARPNVGLTGTLRGRLVVILTVTNCLALALTGSVFVLEARKASQVEIDSSMRLAGVLVADTIRLMSEAPTSLLLQTLALQFRAVRHVRIAVADRDGATVAARLPAAVAQDTAAPKWFAALVAPQPRTEVVPILPHARRVGNVTIVSQPEDEISEAWTYAEPLLVVGFALNLAAAVALFLLYGRVLAPLAALAGGLDALQSRRYGVRLRLPALRELASLTDHFNRTAGALADASEGNRVLHRRLLTAQDDERRRLALELHDEVGPCLFALDANASSIVALTRDGEPRVQERAERVVALVRQVKGINRRVLDQLRPIGLGHMALRDSLEKLLLDFADGAHPPIDASVGPIAESYGPVVDLTIYRCVQEGLFNAVRHAAASRIACAVAETHDGEIGHALRIVIEDDGKGLAEMPPPGIGMSGIGSSGIGSSGIGLSGMRERVEALNGALGLVALNRGTRLTVLLPIGGVGSPPIS